MPTPEPPTPPSAERFQSLVGCSYRIDGTEVELTLAEVDDHGGSFSLLFRSAQLPPVAQSIHQLDPLDGAGDIGPIFLVPVAADEHGATYEAVFN